MDDPTKDDSEQADYLRGWQAGRHSGLAESSLVAIVVGAVLGALVVAVILGGVFWGGLR